ncbi:carboxypeptidase-like regulatory domain-containing protein [Micromonospora sp. WMMD1128]|uniref:carboxypeptidase-like regulatory domain-containing protein n=1 Tax=unclassified Micromonospora TaxID=2617518 RepID=UPI00248ABDD1|nr:MULTISPECIES: carboxypeptidase-like regulatory domain-containing protein [unclassified Micromonospora]WBB76243.1 carboxypeptidase-like regulatory domain-containing protein [Micromonospora sp. WMMD1128]WFE35971.1 carboxypeptidase-like regulatory domain-containing protein [Micromonospora sp. WMMD975]
MTGAIETAVADVATWLTGTAGEPVPVGPPRDDPAGGLTVWPLELRPARQTASGGTAREPYRFVVRLLVSGGGPAALPALDRVLAAAAEGGHAELVLAAGDPALWRALGVAPRPALLLDVPVRIDRPTPTAPPVRQPLQLRQLELRTLDGRVVGPQGQPLAAMRVELVGTAQATETDAAGRFRLVGVPHDPDAPDRPVRIRLIGRGRVHTAELDPAGDDLVVVRAPD